MPRTLIAGLCAAAAVGLAACGGSSGTSASGSSTTSTTAPQKGSGQTSALADKLKAAKLGCKDYQDVPQNPQTFQTGIKDIGNCDIAHLGVFSDANARDKWINQ